MKKVIMSSLVIFMFSCTLAIAQTPSSSTPIIRIGSDMYVNIPDNDRMIYVYEVNVDDIMFRDAEVREKYFFGLQDEVVSYRFDKENKKVYLLLNQAYMDEKNWTVRDVNNYFQNRTAYMKEHYQVYSNQ